MFLPSTADACYMRGCRGRGLRTQPWQLVSLTAAGFVRGGQMRVWASGRMAGLRSSIQCSKGPFSPLLCSWANTKPLYPRGPEAALLLSQPHQCIVVHIAEITAVAQPGTCQLAGVACRCVTPVQPCCGQLVGGRNRYSPGDGAFFLLHVRWLWFCGVCLHGRAHGVLRCWVSSCRVSRQGAGVVRASTMVCVFAVLYS